MSTVLILALSLLAAGSPSQGESEWEEIFHEAGPDGTVTSVWATGRQDWFVGGKWGVARSSGAGIERTAIRGRGILGLFGEAPSSVFALGYDELVLHFDGRTWNQEHIRQQPRRPGRGADLLYSAFYEGATTTPTIVAFGTSMVLVRRAPSTWTLPPDSEKETLLDLAQGGRRDIERPTNCDRAGWFWLGKDRGFFDCHDGRAFLVDAGKVTPKGKLPRACMRSFDALTSGRGEIYASCSGGTIWRTDGQFWRSVRPPKRLRDIPSIAIADGCIFIAGEQSMWRSCQPL
jgi:hypothetical protein